MEAKGSIELISAIFDTRGHFFQEKCSQKLINISNRLTDVVGKNFALGTEILLSASGELKRYGFRKFLCWHYLYNISSVH